MPTKKPVVQVVLEENYYKKLKAIAEPLNRKISDQGRRIIEKYIDEYEKQNGPICTSEKDN